MNIARFRMWHRDEVFQKTSEPVFHISIPLNGWRGEHSRKHHDYLQMRDFPDCWRNLDVTIEVEAKAKELAVQRLMRALGDVT